LGETSRFVFSGLFWLWLFGLWVFFDFNMLLVGYNIEKQMEKN
jgi:membrane protein CcdC involved in cytochrome C biogenesis